MRTFAYCYASLVIAAAIGLFLEHIPFQPYLFLCGGGLSGLGLSLFYKQINFLIRSRLAYGELVDWKEVEVPRGGRGHNYDYYAVVAFEDADGRLHRVTSATGSWPKPRTPTGKKYPVRYSPDHPEEARLDTLFDYWGPAVIILAFGIGIFVVSFYAARSK